MTSGKKMCGEIRALLFDRAAGELADDARAELEAHLAACADCRKLARDIAATAEALDAAPAIAPSERFEAALRRGVAAEQRRERLKRAAGLVVFAAAWRRLREFELGAAVYPLVLLALAYVAWAVFTRAPERPMLVSSHKGPSGRLMLWRGPSRRQAKKMLAKIETAAEKEPPDVSDDPYDLEWLAPVAEDIEPYPPVVERESPASVVRKEPETLQELERLPEPRRVGGAKALLLPSRGPGGSALARARYATIKNSKRHLRVALTRGLLWLCENQNGDGSWSAGEGRRGPGARSEYSDSEVTAAAALAFMETGFRPSTKSRVSRSLLRGLTWLVRQKREDGMFAPPGARQLHAQAMAITALSEALRLTDRGAFRKRFRPDLAEACAALIDRQSGNGAWGGAKGDAEVTAMALIATGSARAAGVSIDAASHASALAWLDSYRRAFGPGVYASGDDRGRAWKNVSYVTIGAVLCSPAGAFGAGARLREAARELNRHPVVWESGDFFRWYAATLAAYRLDGEFWQAWRDALLVQLIPHQNGWLRGGKSRAKRGSWEPVGICAGGGRAYATAMSVLALAASCGHSPVYGSAK